MMLADGHYLRDQALKAMGEVIAARLWRFAEEAAGTITLCVRS